MAVLSAAWMVAASVALMGALMVAGKVFWSVIFVDPPLDIELVEKKACSLVARMVLLLVH